MYWRETNNKKRPKQTKIETTLRFILSSFFIIKPKTGGFLKHLKKIKYINVPRAIRRSNSFACPKSQTEIILHLYKQKEEEEEFFRCSSRSPFVVVSCSCSCSCSCSSSCSCCFSAILIICHVSDNDHRRHHENNHFRRRRHRRRD